MEKRLIFLLISQLILAISCRAAPLKDDNVQQDEKNLAPGDTTQDCEFEGIVYKNGDKVKDNKKACENCHCIAGEVTCSVIGCGQPPEGECTAVVAEGECCPTYDCVKTVRQNSESTVVEGEMSDLTTVITPSFRENLDNEEVLEQVEPEAVESSTLVNDENTEQNELALRTIEEDVTTEEPEGDMQEPTVAESTFREIIVNSPNELSDDNTTPVPEMVDESDGQISGGEFRNEILLEDQVDPTGRSVTDETTLSPFSDDVARTEVPVSEGTKAEGKDSTPMEKSEEDYWSELLRSEAIHEDGKSSSAAVEETENVATEKTRENSEESATLRSIPLAKEAEDSTNSASEARTDASVREESTDASLREESTESSVNELEVVPKIFRSEIDNLKFPLEEENSDSYILSQDEATTEALESRSEDELTTVGAELRSSAAEATTVLPEEARTGDEEDDYWKNMMLGQSDPVDTMKNIDTEVDASESKNVESVTENIALEDTTALFFRSNLGEDGLGDTEERVEGEVTTERTISDELRLDEEENEDSATESLVRAGPDDVEVTTLSSNEADNDAPLRERSGLTVEEATTPIVDSAQDVRDSETETETETGIETETGTEEEPSTAGDDVLGLKSEATTLIPNDESSPEDSAAASSGEPAQKNDEASDQETESVPESESNDENDEESSPENRDADLSKQEESNSTKSENVDSKISSESNSIQSDEKDEQVSNESTNVPSTPKVKRKRMFEKIVKPPSQLHKFPHKSEKYPRKLMANNTKRIASKFHHLASKYGLRPVVRKSRRYGGRSLIRNARL